MFYYATMYIELTVTNYMLLLNGSTYISIQILAIG